MRSVLTATLTLLGCTVAAQPARPPADGVLAPEVELPPRYRIEFILFAHNRFDANEEYFDVVPPASQFAASDEPIPMRFYDADSGQALRDLIEGSINAPPAEEPGPEAPAADADMPPVAIEPLDDSALMLEAFLDPRLIEGPNTRYLDLHEFMLFPALDRLVRLDAYTPLVHSGWEQNGLPEDDAVAIDLAEFDSTNPRGTLRLHMSRYLHMAVDLVYRDEPLTPEEEQIPGFGDFELPPLPPTTRPGFGFSQLEPIEEPAKPEFYLLEQRRILRGELNYFDHPAFGVLLQITLAPEPELDSDTEADGPSA